MKESDIRSIWLGTESQRNCWTESAVSSHSNQVMDSKAAGKTLTDIQIIRIHGICP